MPELLTMGCVLSRTPEMAPFVFITEPLPGDAAIEVVLDESKCRCVWSGDIAAYAPTTHIVTQTA